MTNHPIFPADVAGRYEVRELRNSLTGLAAAHRLDGASGDGCPVAVFGIGEGYDVED